MGYTGGFIFGYIPLTLLCGIRAKPILSVAFGVLGLLLCHIGGVIQYMLLSQLNFFPSFLIVSLPYLLKDIVLVIGAYFVGEIIKKRIKNTV